MKERSTEKKIPKAAGFVANSLYEGILLVENDVKKLA